MQPFHFHIVHCSSKECINTDHGLLIYKNTLNKKPYNKISSVQLNCTEAAPPKGLCSFYKLVI